MQNGTEIIRADSNGEASFVVVKTIKNGDIKNQRAIKSLKLSVEIGKLEHHIEARSK